MTRIEYYNLHCICPECGSDNYESTCIGYIFNKNKSNEYQDENRVKCVCGWTGRVHDLTHELFDKYDCDIEE